MRLKQLLCVCLAAALVMVSPVALAAEAEETSAPIPPAVEETTIPDSEKSPSTSPTVEPTAEPSAEPSIEPTTEPSVEPTAEPSTEPTTEPSVEPSTEPTAEPSPEPTAEPTAEPSSEPSVKPVDDIPPVIYMTVPEIGYVIVNPYRLKTMADGVETTEQIIGNAMTLTNYSSVPVQVNANVFSTVPAGSSMIYAPAPLAENEPRKALFVYLEFQNSADGSEPYSWSSQYSDAPNQLLVTEVGNSKNGLLTLGAGNTNPTYGKFRLLGEAAGSPAEMWTDADRVHITVTFTFTPLYPKMPLQE